MLDLFGCCRLCLKQDETVIVNCAEIDELGKTVEQVFGFKITFNDKCTTKLCKDCIHKVTSFAMYRDTVLSNQKSLEQYIILNEKLTTNSELKDEDSDVIVIECIDEQSPNISIDEINEISAPDSPSSEDDIPLMKLICSQGKKSVIEKENINDTIEKPKTIYKKPNAVVATNRTLPNYTKINLKHFKSAKVKIHRLNETSLRRLSKSYNQLKLQEENRASKSEHIVPIREAPSTSHLVNSKHHNQGEVQSRAIVAQLLSAVNKHGNPPNIINGGKTPTTNNAQLKSGVFIVENDNNREIPTPIVCSPVEKTKARSCYINDIVSEFIKKRLAQINLTNENGTNPINNRNANALSDEAYYTKQKQTHPAPTATNKTKETNIKLPANRKRKSISIGQQSRRALPKLSPTTINEKILLIIKNENKDSANAPTHPLPLSISKDTSPNRIESIDLTEPTGVDSGSNQILIWQNQSTNSSPHLSDKTPYQSKYLLDHTYNLIEQQMQVQQSQVSPQYPHHNYSLQNPSNIESKKDTEPLQLQVQTKPPTSAQSSTILNKTTIPYSHIVNNSNNTPQNLQEQLLIVHKPLNIQFKETEPVQRQIPSHIAQDSIMPNKAGIACAPAKSSLTHTPQHFPERRVKVLSVNELNMRAAEFSRNESLPPRKLPIRITLVKIQNEVQIKLTDSNNKDINFHDLTPAEQQAVKCSLIEPACKEQILAAIKTCSPDQYSANMLRCVGFKQGEIS